MPRAQFSRPMEGINVTKTFATPRSVQDIKAWYRSVMKTIPAVPKANACNDEWTYDQPIVTESTILFQLRHRKTGERAAVIIDRKAGYIGRT